MDKTHWKKKFNYDYLGSYSIEDGKDLILTIKEAKTEPITGDGGRKEDCLVCHFEENVKPMILNRTNCKIIEKVHKTAFIEEWPGKKIQIYIKAGIEAFGQVVEGLRVRPYKPTTKKPDLLPDTELWKQAVVRLTDGTSIGTVEKHYTLSDENREKIILEAMNGTESNQLELQS